jgi:hypothetical protein
MTSADTAPVASTHVRRRRTGLFQFTAIEGFLVGVTTAAVQFGTAFVYGITPTQMDFAIFQRTTQRFLDGQRMYSADSFDFTPPIFHVLLLPFARIEPRMAFVLWTAANIVVAWIVLKMVLQAIPDAWPRRWVIAAWVVNAVGVQMTVRLGQVSWLVALMVTCAWLAARSSRWVAAGLWAGMAIAFKPFLLVAIPVFVVRRQWKALAVCVPTIVACCGLSLVLFGRPAFSDWIGNLREIPDPVYAMHFLNASWLALMARARLPYVVGSVLSVATIMVMLWRVRSKDEDETWLLLLISALLASPLGWVYYQPMLLGPVVALAMSGRLTRLRWLAAACVFPSLSARFLQDGSAAVAVTLGSIYFWGFLTAFVLIVVLRDRPYSAEYLALPVTTFGESLG